MARDAIPEHEIKAIVSRLAAGEDLKDIQRSSQNIAPIWFQRNAGALLKRAGVAALAPAGDPEDDDEKGGKGGKGGKK